MINLMSIRNDQNELNRFVYDIELYDDDDDNMIFTTIKLIHHSLLVMT